ncbi:ABC transporter ATP-binding protein [Wenzhouxiangella marina]|uniref:ABC transporter ATP-binding protein n=1 Tax=Wenzhouxiangella marina TaxID=1579979 RepID=A0A0K0Y0B8_9GAMM|nr:ATP-binding cassette domain-containing protein [Wenzhouxiangella marina]AKS43332.1 ABC transporter ATP-binding protein [Wenzhouxiangella marina]MBB6088553.1 sodium transport system ATP-binding protein [Wenzhouxiangella marina]
MIEAKQLRKTFNKGKVVAVDEVSFLAMDGQITGLLGPNGAGKTTTMRMLYTLLSPDSGSMRIDGIDPAAEPLKVKRALGVVPDSRGLYDRLTARENIRYYGKLQGLDEARIEERIEYFARVLDMGGFIDRKTDGFSQGQRVKVAIARALIHDPRTVLLDEPSNGLDVMTTRALRGFLNELKREGRCVVLSTHIMQEVAALCDRIVIIAKGRVAAQGTAQELIEQSGQANLEDAFVKLIGSDEGLLA